MRNNKLVNWSIQSTIDPILLKFIHKVFVFHQGFKNVAILNYNELRIIVCRE